jgi:diaminopimelate epimerase
MLHVIKAHAYGNDFIYVPAAELDGRDRSALAVRLCERHRGIGADGLILYTLSGTAATMTLLNADGTPSELSGNGLRGLAAIVVWHLEKSQTVAPGAAVHVGTTAGPRTLILTGHEGSRYHFDAGMGRPVDLRQVDLDVQGEPLRPSVLSIGNPQCVVLGPLPDATRFARLGPALERHPFFPNRTNVEFAQVESPDRVRILIWERGVGPTESSGTGSCAAAVAAIAHGGAARQLDVVAPGGTQRVRWADDQVWLSGWAEVLHEGEWVADL